MSASALTSKERAYLRSLANTLEPIFQFGKGGLSDNFVKQIDEALEARELIKLTILENADTSAKELAAELCERAHCQSVQLIGRRIVLYRMARDKDKRKIELPR